MTKTISTTVCFEAPSDEKSGGPAILDSLAAELSHTPIDLRRHSGERPILGISRIGRCVVHTPRPPFDRRGESRGATRYNSDPPAEADAQLRAGLERVQVDAFVFQRPPEPLK